MNGLQWLIVNFEKNHVTAKLNVILELKRKVSESIEFSTFFTLY